MRIISENKLLFSLVLALSMVLVVILIFTTAQVTPAMSRYSDKPYYEIPKGDSPEALTSPDVAVKSRAKMGFIDPIVVARMQEEREVPTPIEILNAPGITPGLSDSAFTNVKPPEIPGYGKAPKSPYDVMYDENSPFKFTGRPGRLGEKMSEYMKPNDQRKKELGLDGEPYIPEGTQQPEAQVNQQRTIKSAENVDIQKFRNAMLKLFLTVLQSRGEIPPESAEPVEGKLVDATPEDLEKIKNS